MMYFASQNMKVAFCVAKSNIKQKRKKLAFLPLFSFTFARRANISHARRAYFTRRSRISPVPSERISLQKHIVFLHIQSPAEPCNRLWETLPCKVGLYHWHHCSQRPNGSRDKSIVASVGEVCKTASEPLFRVPLIKCRFLYVRLSRTKQVKLKFKRGLFLVVVVLGVKSVVKDSGDALKLGIVLDLNKLLAVLALNAL